MGRQMLDQPVAAYRMNFVIDIAIVPMSRNQFHPSLQRITVDELTDDSMRFNCSNLSAKKLYINASDESDP